MNDFINHGKLRMRSLQYHRITEDRARADKTEGEAHIQVPGTVEKMFFFPDNREHVEVVEEYGLQQHHMTLGNPVFVFCTSQSHAEPDFLKRKFGKFLVQIKNPKQLAADILSYLSSIPEINAKYIEGHSVKYSKGHTIDVKPENSELITLSYTQKPDSFSPECEFRYVVVSMEPPPQREAREFIDINLNMPLSYVDFFNS